MRTLTMQDKEGLVEALKRYGYTRVIPYSLSYHVSLHSPCESTKPYHIIIDFTEDGTPLTIYHDGCGSYLHALVNRVHTENFLKSMIPIIGRLDAQADYEDGGESEYFDKREPRLRIYL